MRLVWCVDIWLDYERINDDRYEQKATVETNTQKFPCGAGRYLLTWETLIIEIDRSARKWRETKIYICVHDMHLREETYMLIMLRVTVNTFKFYSSLKGSYLLWNIIISILTQFLPFDWLDF